MTKAPTVLITGATSGIGFEAARRLAAAGSTVIVHARTREDGAQAIVQLLASGCDPARLDFAVADFTRLHEVTTMAGSVAKRHPRIDVLVNNAATAAPPSWRVTEDGNEETLQVNYLAAFVLTRLLNITLLRSESARVVNVSSSRHLGAGIDWTDINRGRRYRCGAVYGQSKLALTMLTTALAMAGRTAVSVHPGIIATDLLPCYGFQGRPVADGAEPLVHLCSPDTAVRSGAYYHGRVIGRPAELVEDARAVDRLWRLSERLVDPTRRTGSPSRLR